MTANFRYTEWDGLQELTGLDADDVLESLTDDLMNFGDLQHALRNLLQRGMRDPNGQRMAGLRDLLQQLRQERRQTLERFNLNSAFEDLKKKLDDIIKRERDTVERRMQSAQSGEAGPESASKAPPQDGPQGNPLESDPEALQKAIREALEALERGEQPGDSGEGSSGEGESGEGGQGQPSAGGSRSQSGGGSPGQQGGSARSGQGQAGQGGNDDLAEMLRSIAERKRNFLENLPQDLGGAMKELQNYEFLDPEAQHEYQELVEQLKKAMMETFFKDLSQHISSMSPEDMARMKQMVDDLNAMLADRIAGREPDFPGFMDKYGDLFGDNLPQNLDDLVERMQQQASQMQSLLNSLPGEMRQQLQDLLSDKIGDPGMQAGVAELAANLEFLHPSRDTRGQYPFRGDEELDLQAAMQLMDRMQNMDELERQLERSQYGGDIEDIDEERLRDLLGDEAAEALEQMKKLLEVLEEAGYIRKKGQNGWELTPRGTRRIGQKALGEIYAQLKKDSQGRHAMRERGIGGERSDDTKQYEFGDPFHLHLGKTVMNSTYRQGPGVPVRLDPADFEVYRSETLTQTHTVMMVDLSWSMALRGSFQAAKKVALALNNLITGQFQHDNLYIIGFSAYARELKAEQLPYVRWDESVLGTNMHHALMMAQKMLAKHTTGTRQIIMISDGEPTAHLENGRSYFAYPPSPVTIRETLKEVKRATQKGIIINTFMLDRNYYLKEFVNQVAKINEGRVFYTTPDKLGEYVLVDYVNQKRKNIRGGAA